MSIDLKTISQLREMTGAGIGDCKNALAEAGGDIDKAVEILRKKGEIKAAKKSDRAANEGLVAIARSGKQAAIVALNCETDFVAKNEDFIKAVQDLADQLLNLGPEDFKQKAEQKIKNELVVKIGENIQLGDFGIFEGEVLGTYLHSNRKVAAVVSLSGGSQELADDVAMQIAAMAPKCLKPADVPTGDLDKEREIYREQLKNEGKPENIWDKIIQGKLNKYYEDICLLNQIFIKDEKKKISDLLATAGPDVVVNNFKRFSI